MTVKPTPNASRAVRRLGILALLALLCAGCGDEGRGGVEVQGTVSAGGQPLPKGSVVFVPVESASGHKSAGAVVDGKFHIAEEIGPIPGDYKIEVYAAPAAPVALDDPRAYAKQYGRKAPPANAVAPRYNKQTVLTETVAPAGANTFDLQVQWRRPASAR